MAYGDIELRSGKWKWTVAELDGGPADEADAARIDGRRTVLLLEDPMDLEHWMARELPNGRAKEPLSEQDVRSLARDPDRRHFMDDDGEVWLIEKIDRPPATRTDAELERGPPKVRVSENGGPKRIMALPDEQALGTLSSDELIRLARG